MTSPYPNGAPDVITHIRQQADAVVRQVNPGRDYTAPWFAGKVTEVTEAMVRKFCLDSVSAGRPDLARKIRIAWEQDNPAPAA